MSVGLRSRCLIQPFELLRPKTDIAAQAALREPGINVVMAGGIDLIDGLKSGFAVDRVIHLGDIPELKTIQTNTTDVIVGAMVTHDQVINRTREDLGHIWQSVANPRIRFTGTIGGNLMARRPHYDAMPALLALNASAEVIEDDGTRRSIALTDLRPSMLLTALRIPKASTKLIADRSLHPMVSIYAAKTGNTVRIAIGCACERPFAVDAPNQTVLDILRETLPPTLTDGLATAAYRRAMVGVLARRVLQKIAA